jgi:hypothetical protein
MNKALDKLPPNSYQQPQHHPGEFKVEYHCNLDISDELSKNTRRFSLRRNGTQQDNLGNDPRNTTTLCPLGHTICPRTVKYIIEDKNQ